MSTHVSRLDISPDVDRGSVPAVVLLADYATDRGSNPIADDTVVKRIVVRSELLKNRYNKGAICLCDLEKMKRVDGKDVLFENA